MRWKTLAELAEKHDVHSTPVAAWKSELLLRWNTKFFVQDSTAGSKEWAQSVQVSFYRLTALPGLIACESWQVMSFRAYMDRGEQRHYITVCKGYPL
jgi:hypothetical protein